MNPRILIAIVGVSLVAVAQEASKTSHSAAASHTIHTPDSIQWKPGPPSLPPGAKFAVLEGDPSQEGFFTMRVLMPDGYSVAPHIHPAVEHVTVMRGTLHFGMGEKFDKAATQPLPAGTFGYWPAGMKHFAWIEGETVLQVHGMGPWGIQYVNPADDPRNQKDAAKVLTADPQRLEATFLCDALPSHRLELRKDGTFKIDEPGGTISGRYTIEASSLKLEPDGHQPLVGQQFDGKGFLDPHGSHWSLK